MRAKVRAHPELSIVADKMEANRAHFLGNALQYIAGVYGYPVKWVLLISPPLSR